MLVANSASQKGLLAWQTPKTAAPFYCPTCSSEVILKKGEVREHHFAHKPPFTCEYGRGESQQRIRVKRELFQNLIDRENCERVALERQLKGVVRF